MKSRKRALGVALCLSVCCTVLLLSARQVEAEQGKVETTVATIRITRGHISESNISRILRKESREKLPRIKVKQLNEAAIYRGLMDGKIDLGSVLALPEDVGVKEFKKSFKQPPKVMTLGHLTVSVIAPKKTGVRRFSVKQLGEVISGKITTWEQLGGKGGKIKILADQNAVDLICVLAGVKCAAEMRILPHPSVKIAVSIRHSAPRKGGDLRLGLTSANCFTSSRLRKLIGGLPITAGDDAKAVAPTLVTVRDGSYPLARPWRLILRPGAPPLAKRCLDILANPRGRRGRLDMIMSLWLIDPAVSPIPSHIRIGIIGWYCELRAAAKVYKQKNPQVTFTFLTSSMGVKVIPGFIDSRVDLLAHTGQFRGHLGGLNYDLWRKAYPKLPTERTIAYWPFAVIVHPKNPIKSLTMAHLHRLAADRRTRWKDLGRPKGGRLRFYVYHTINISRAIWGYDLATGQNNGPRKLKTSEGLACKQFRVRVKRGNHLTAMAEDVDCLGIWYHDHKIAASGLKVLPIISGKGRLSARPTDLPAVASGRYVLRTPLKILIHPKANKATREFVEWLVTPQAGEVMRIEKVKELTDCRGLRTVAHVSLAAKDTNFAKTPKPRLVEDNGIKFKQSVSGAVAVLPTEPLSMYFLMADRSHHAAYERAITKALEADGRLKLVDRTQLARVLAERKLELLGIRESRPKPIVSADIFVLSHVVTEGAKTYLRIQAVHGPTAGLLGELKLPIDPAAPTRFTPPLSRTVAGWWPGVLKRLVCARTRPVWTLLDVYAGTKELGDQADEFRQSLRKSLVTDERIFLAGGASLGQTQQEVLMRLLGLSRPRGGRFTPAADYVLDARIPSAGQVELRIRGGDLAVIEQTTLTETDDKKLLAAAKNWLTGWMSRHAAKPKPLRPSADVEDKWARKQARVEYEIGMRLRKEYHRTLRRCDKMSQQEHKEFAEFIVRYWRTLRRAAQLDPTWDEAAYAALYTYGNPRLYVAGSSYGKVNRYNRPGESIDAKENFLKTFPKSKHYEKVLCEYAISGVFMFKARVPPGLDARRIKLTYMRKGLDGYARYMEKYRLTGKADSRHQAYMCFRHYMSWLRKYIALAEPSEKELQAIVDDWSERYDRHPDKAPHSDFVRLIILRYKADKPGYLALLRKLQKQWPDPKHPQWKEMRDMVRNALSGMFSMDGSKHSFHLWLMGKRGIGDLPYVGYDAAAEARKAKELRGMLPIYCQGWKKALIAARKEFKKLHPKVEVMYFQMRGDNKLLSAANGPTSIIAYVGPLTAEQRKRLEEVYGGKLQEQLIGYRIDPASPSKREPVMLLIGPRSQKHKVANEFVKFLATPAARAAMAKHNIHNKTAKPKTTIAPADKDAVSKEN